MISHLNILKSEVKQTKTLSTLMGYLGSVTLSPIKKLPRRVSGAAHINRLSVQLHLSAPAAAASMLRFLGIAAAVSRSGSSQFDLGFVYGARSTYTLDRDSPFILVGQIWVYYPAKL